MMLADILQQRAGEVIQVTPDIPVRTVIALLGDHRIGAVPVVEDGVVIGIMSERDVIYSLQRDGAAILEWPVERVMTRPVITVESSLSPLAGLSLMTRRRIRHLPVVEGGRVIGVVSIGDLVKAVISEQGEQIEQLQRYIAG